MWLFLYYSLAQFIPMHPFPGWGIGYALRSFLCKKILKSCGENIICKNRCYFGKGNRLEVGNRSQLGQNARLNGQITLGDDVIMGPDVVMMATSHAYARIDTPINQQGHAPEKPITIGDDVWIGTRVLILPGVYIGSHSIIGGHNIGAKVYLFSLGCDIYCMAIDNRSRHNSHFICIILTLSFAFAKLSL